MCNPTTHRPISEAMPFVNALIAEAERNCIDIHNVNVFAHAGGRFAIDLVAYDGGGGEGGGEEEDARVVADGDAESKLGEDGGRGEGCEGVGGHAAASSTSGRG